MECFCLKPAPFCVCQKYKKLENSISVVILQHPKEPKELLGTGGLLKAFLKDCQINIGLSWPNFKKATLSPLPSSDFLVLYLGSGKKTTPVKNMTAKKGIIVLDGTWSQSKTLWWRNPWLTKIDRLILEPEKKSLYGKLRREPRKDCLSTLESIAEGFDVLGEKKEIGEALRHQFSLFLKEYQKSLT